MPTEDSLFTPLSIATNIYFTILVTVLKRSIGPQWRCDIERSYIFEKESQPGTSD